MRHAFRQIIVFHSHVCGDTLCVYKVRLFTHSLEAILRLKFYHCCEGGLFFFIVYVHYRSDETTCSFSLRGWGKALYCSGEPQLSFSSTEKRHERLMEGENCWDWKFISFIFVFYFALNNFMLDILLKNGLFLYAELKIQHASLEKFENLRRHKTEGFSSSKALVVRRGAPFRVSLQLEGRPFNPKMDSLRIKLSLGTHRSPPQSLICKLGQYSFASLSFLVSGLQYMFMPVTFSKKASSTRWQAYFEPQGLDLHRPSIFISCPVSASVGSYTLELGVSTQGKRRRCMIGKFILLCNPWCSGKR